MIYTSVSSAVVSAMAAEAKSRTAGQAWQKLYNPHEPGDLASLARGSAGSLDRGLVDDWIAARLHHLLLPRHWNALAAKYSTHKQRKVEAIAHLKAVVASSAPPLFLFKAVTAWAIPKLPGARLKQKSVTVELPIDASEWRRDAAVKAAIAAGLAEQKKANSRSADMIVLPDSFYDMNTWDVNGAPESTRRRWRQNIFTTLDEMKDEALAHAESILRAEGVLLDEVA
ncbi:MULTISPECIES: hypothetical protein [unclassified Pseudomonas]|uniref:hypothetical protein n=1 Tax=unclassified Pseudomonas TaxID=196821 RepID=UPI000D38B5FB|nr:MULTISPECIES: hypothetical protein [unclassified Pseudomonas]RAU43451.1 hypothetical protein DBP26_019825 [Pseudomonas sp. RIT 409]RAU50013.1 hypothetical protein DBY65_022960 [Pseudomonas sp. RIT 412]